MHIRNFMAEQQTTKVLECENAKKKKTVHNFHKGTFPLAFVCDVLSLPDTQYVGYLG